MSKNPESPTDSGSNMPQTHEQDFPILTFKSKAELDVHAESVKLLYEQSEYPFVLFNGESGNIEAFNSAALKFFSMDAELFEQQSIFSLSASSSKTIEKHFENIISFDKKIFQFSARLEHGVVQSMEAAVIRFVAGKNSLLSVVMWDVAADYRSSSLSRDEHYWNYVSLSTDPIWCLESKVAIPVDAPLEQQLRLIYRYAVIQECNTAMATIFGDGSRSSVLGKRLKDVISTGRGAKKSFMLAFLKNRYNLKDYRASMNLADGSIREFLVNIQGIVENNHLVKAWGSSRDITDLLEAEHGQKESETLYKSLFDSSTDSIIIIENGKIRNCNKTSLKAFGYSSNEVKGKTLLELAPELQPGGERSENLLLEAQSNALAGTPQSFECALLRKNGKPFHSNITIRKVETGQESLLIVTVEDITDLRASSRVLSVMLKIIEASRTSTNLQELLKTIQEQLGTLIDTTNFYVALYDNQSNTYTLPYCVDEKDEPIPVDTPIDLSKSLTEYVRRTGKPHLIGKAEHEALAEKGEIVLHGHDSPIWLGVPLITGDGIIGVVVVQSYDSRNTYTLLDLELLELASEYITNAIQHQRADDALGQSEERYRALFYESPVGVFLFDRNYHITQCNTQFQELLDCEYSDIVKLELTEVFSEKLIETCRQVFEKTVTSQSSDSVSLFGKDLTISLTVSPVYNAAGKVINGMAVVEDITARVKAEDEIRVRRAYLEELIEGAPEAIAIVDTEDRVLRINKEFERLFGFSSEEVKRKKNDFVVPLELREEAEEWVKKAADGELISVESQRQAKNGKTFDVSILGKPIRIGDKLVGVYWIYRDISLRKKSERIRNVMFKISQAVSTTGNLGELLSAVHACLGELLSVENFFVALYDSERDTYSFPISIDRFDAYELNRPYDMKGGMTDFVRRSGKSQFVDTRREKQLVKTGKVTRKIGTGSKIWLGTPLRTSKGIVGVVAVQDYEDPKAYTRDDLKLLESVSSQIAIGIERKLAETALRESEQLYRNLFDETPLGVFIFDKHLRIIESNERFSAIMGVPRDLQIGFDLRRLKNKELIPFFENTFKGEPVSWRGPYNTVLSDKEIYVSGYLQPLFDEKNVVYSGLCVIEDITESVRQEFLKSILLNISESSRTAATLEMLLKTVHDELKRMFSIDNIYVALYDESTDLYTLPYYFENGEQIYEPKPIELMNSMTDVVRHEGEARISTKQEFEEEINAGRLVPHCDLPEIWMGVPLKGKSGVIGVLAIHSNDKAVRYTDDDLTIFEFIASYTATAIERKQNEDALRESEERIRKVTSTVDAYLWSAEVIDENTFHHTLYTENILQITGYPAEAFLEGDSDFWMKLVVEEDQPVIETSIKKLLKGVRCESSYRIRRKDGEIRWIYDAATPILDHSGFVSHLNGVAFDITSRKMAEEALASEKERLSVTLRSIGDAVISTDLDGKIKLMNPIAERLTGWQMSDAAGKPLDAVFNIVNEKTGIQINDWIKPVLSSGFAKSANLQCRLIGRNGSERIIARNAAPMRDRFSKIIGAVIVFRDITKHRELEEELLQARKLESIGLLAGGIAHDFNNILSGILGSVSLAKVYISAGKDPSERLDIAEKATLRAKDLTQQLLTFSKGGAPIKTTASITELITDSAHFALRGSKVKGLLDLDPDLCDAEVDPGQISQVLQNLIINADQAMPEGGTIRIKASNIWIGDGEIPVSPGKFIRIILADEGIGIPPKHLKRIFDPYFTTKQRGSGLGLATAFSIISRHDGHITVESELNKGTTFTLYLPASDQTAEHIDKKQAIYQQFDGKVLLLDDEEVIVEVAGNMLEVLGFEVVSAQDGQEAVQKFEEAYNSGKPFNLILFDLTIPGGMGGQEAFEKIREIDSEIKGIVSSGYSNDPVMADHKLHGFAGVIAKPYQIEELQDIIKKILSNGE